jgi:hypothetical protein
LESTESLDTIEKKVTADTKIADAEIEAMEAR